MPESTLVTYTCGHYSITPQILSLPMEEDLYRIATTRHRPSRHHCIGCGNEAIPPQELRTRFETALQGIREFLTNAKCHYFHLGVRYSCISSKARSSTPATNLAQSQFCIEERRWNVDPFFSPWLQLLKLVSRAEIDLEADNLDQSVGSLFDQINEARAFVGKIVGAMWALGEGVKEIEDRERMQDFGNRIKLYARTKKIEIEEANFGPAKREAARLQREKRAREEVHEAERRDLRRAAFEQALFESWKARIEGLEHIEMEVRG